MTFASFRENDMKTASIGVFNAFWPFLRHVVFANLKETGLFRINRNVSPGLFLPQSRTLRSHR